MSKSDDNSVIMESRVMNDDEIYLILWYLTFKEKLKLISVSKQFFDRVNQSIRCQKILKIKVTFEKKQSDFDCVVSIEKEMNKRLPLIELDFNTIREKFESSFRKLSNLKQLILELETINSQFCEWISTIFPSIERIGIYIHRNESWNRDKFYFCHLFNKKKIIHL
jgi:hypothetical protein